MYTGARECKGKTEECGHAGTQALQERAPTSDNVYTNYLVVDPVLHDLSEQWPVLLQHVGGLQVVSWVCLVQGQAHRLISDQIRWCGLGGCLISRILLQNDK